MNDLFHSSHSTNLVPTARQLEQRRHARAAQHARRRTPTLVDRLVGRVGAGQSRHAPPI